jgi:hypothetical protein
VSTRSGRSRAWSAHVAALRWLAGCAASPPSADDQRRLRRRGAGSVDAIREIALDTFDGAPEASETTLFDRSFRPACRARERWQRVWLAPSGGWPGVTPVGPLESPAQD